MSTVLVSISSEPLEDEEDKICPFLMRESMEKGGNSMLARQVSLAPSFLVVTFLSASRSNIKPKVYHNFLSTHIANNHYHSYIGHLLYHVKACALALTFVIVNVYESLGKYHC